MTTDPPRRRRRLAAILMADVVGFSRMMGRDEDATTDRILAFHKGMEELVEKHGGRVVSTSGDSVFGDFDSIVGAMECSAEIQQRLADANDRLPDDERIDTRIGLHLGDVIVEEYNVFGDGVNIAARLEQLAEPGGIVLSEAVYQQIRGRTELPIEEMGLKHLKNIDEPVRLYQVPAAAFGEPPPSDDDPLVPAPVEPPAPPAHGDLGDHVGQAVDAVIERTSGGSPPDKEELKRTIRESIMNVAKAAAAQSGSEDDDDQVIEMDRDRRPLALFRFPTLLMIGLGVLAIVGWSTEWTDNGVYPWLGCTIIGIAFGSAVERMSGRDGISSFFFAIGLGAGAFFLGSVAWRIVMWVLALGSFSSAMQKLAKR